MDNNRDYHKISINENWDWEFEIDSYYRAKNYEITYYTSEWYYYQDLISDSANLNEDDFILSIRNDNDYNKVLSWEVLDENVKSIEIRYDIIVEDFNWWKWEKNTYSKSWKMNYNVSYYDKNGKLYYSQKIYID